METNLKTFPKERKGEGVNGYNTRILQWLYRFEKELKEEIKVQKAKSTSDKFVPKIDIYDILGVRVRKYRCPHQSEYTKFTCRHGKTCNSKCMFMAY